MPITDWTHFITVNSITPARDNDNGIGTAHFTIEEGPGVGEKHSLPYPKLCIVEGLEGKHVLASIDFKESWIRRLHPGHTSIDAVSLSMMKMLKLPFEDLKKAWVDTDVISPIRKFICDDPKQQDSLIVYANRRYHWEGENKGITFRYNEVSFEGETPQVVLQSVKLKRLRDIVDHPGIPKDAIATSAWCRKNKTYIAYDVEDIEMEKVFGPITRQTLKN